MIGKHDARGAKHKEAEKRRVVKGLNAKSASSESPVLSPSIVLPLFSEDLDPIIRS